MIPPIIHAKTDKGREFAARDKICPPKKKIPEPIIIPTKIETPP